MRIRTVSIATAAVAAAAAAVAAAAAAQAAPAPVTRVTGLHVTAATTGSLTVAWNAQADTGARVRVQVYDANTLADTWDSAYKGGIAAGKTSVTATGLQPGTAYVVRADASDGSANAGWTAGQAVFTKASGADGGAGPAGPAGPKGADGTVGDVLHNSSAPVTIPAGGEAQAYATCAADPVHGLAPNGAASGYIAVGGGYSVDGGSTGADKVDVTMSRDELTNTAGAGWLVQAHDDDTASHTIAAWVICASAPADQAGT